MTTGEYGRPAGLPTDQQRVLEALAEQEPRSVDGVFLDDVARVARLPKEYTRDLLHALMTGPRLVRQIGGVDELGPRYQLAERD